MKRYPRMIHINLVIVLLLLFVFIAPLNVGVPLQAAPNAVTRFAAVGDYGDNTANEQAVANLINSWNPEFIITMGDNSYGAAAPVTPAVSTIDQNIGKYYHNYIGNYTGGFTPGAITNKFFPSIGNHDYSDGGGISAYLSYFTLPGNERYYDFVQGPVHFFAIDSDSNEPDGNTSSSTQAAWLQTRLNAAAEMWKIVYFHHAPYSSSSTHGNSTWMQWPFREWGATAVLAGHVHNYERLNKNGFPYFVNGSGGHGLYGWNATPEPGSMVRYNSNYGAMLIEADTTKITFKFYSIAGGAGGTLIDTLTKNPTTVSLTSFDVIAIDSSRHVILLIGLVVAAGIVIVAGLRLRKT